MKNNNLNILHEDSHIIVCVKPSGVPTQSKNTAVSDMVSILKTHIYTQNPQAGEPYLSIIHRLDQPVEGILVFAKTNQAARELNRQLQMQGFGKYYRALTDGIPPHEEDTLENYMIKDGRTNTSSVCTSKTSGAKLARLHYKIVQEGPGYFKKGHEETGWGRRKSSFPPSPSEPPTELDIHLDTGRHHQIRVQLAYLGCPIAGDTKYNPHCATSSGEWQQIRLCAYKLSFKHPVTKKQMTFSLL